MRAVKTLKPLPLEPFTKQGLSFLRAPLLKEAPSIEHAFMTRAGGVSPQPFNALNFGGDDTSANIKANMELLGSVFSLPSCGVATVEQVHGSHVVVMEKAGERSGTRPCGDAIITARAGLPIGILTADCVPVLLHDPVSGAIAAVHAGWRGFVAGVLGQTLSVMSRDFGARPAHILAAIGPHIGPCCYEVSEDLITSFKKAGFATESCFTWTNGVIRLNLGLAVSEAITALGLASAHLSRPGPCTSCNDSSFYSYRRERVTGRQLSFIMKR
ncbi:MAG: peptidoglycan editing factor PgeF [Thermodesulfobacteriota bacterium]